MGVTAQHLQEINAALAPEAITPTVPSPSSGRQGRRPPIDSALEAIDENPSIRQNLQTASGTKILDCCLPESVRAGMEKIIADKSIPEEVRRNYQEILDDPAKFQTFYDSQTDATRMALGSQDPKAQIGVNSVPSREAINRDQILEIGKQIGEQLQQNPELITATSSTSNVQKVELNFTGDTKATVATEIQQTQPDRIPESNPTSDTDSNIKPDQSVRTSSDTQAIQTDNATVISHEALNLKTTSVNEVTNTRAQSDIAEQPTETIRTNLSQRIEIEVDNRRTDTVTAKHNHSNTADDQFVKNQETQTQQVTLRNNDPSPQNRDTVIVAQLRNTSSKSLISFRQDQSPIKDLPTAKTSQIPTKFENLGNELRDQLHINRITERSSEIRAQLARESLNVLMKSPENTSNKNIPTSSIQHELSKKIQVSSHPIERDHVKVKNVTVQRQEQLTVRNVDRLTAVLNPRDIIRLAESLRNNSQTEALSKRLEQISKMLDANRLQDRGLAEKQLTRIAMRELLNTIGRQETIKLLRALRQTQATTDTIKTQQSIKQAQSPVVTEQVSKQIASRVAVIASQKDISRFAQTLRANEALTKKYGIETIQSLSKRLEQLAQDPTKLDRQKFKVLIKEIRETLGKDGDKLIKQLYRDIQLRNNPNERSLLVRQLEVKISADRTERILSAMRLNNPLMSSLPNTLQRLIAVYLMQQIAQYRTAQDLIAMVEEVNAEWAAMLKEKDIEMLLRAGVEVADSDAGNQRRKRRIVSRSLPQDITDKKRITGFSKKQATTEGITSTSKNAAKIGQNVKAETSSPIAELIISRVKSGDKKPKESDE